jgi:hypothetical protein
MKNLTGLEDIIMGRFKECNDTDSPIINWLLQNGYKKEDGALGEKGYTKVYNVCFRMTNNTDDASEMAQETFIKAYKNIKSFKGNSSLFTWLYRIASNICLDFLRTGLKLILPAMNYIEIGTFVLLLRLIEQAML